MRFLRTLAALWLVPVLAFSALKVSVEVPLSDAEFIEAPFGQINPAVATDGQNFLIVWEDYRRGLYVPDIYGARLTPDGEVLDPGGIPLGTGPEAESRPRVSWEGSRYVVTWSFDRVAQSIDIGSDGAILSSPRSVFDLGQPQTVDATTAAATVRVWSDAVLDYSYTAGDIYAEIVRGDSRKIEPRLISRGVPAQEHGAISVADEGIYGTWKETVPNDLSARFAGFVGIDASEWWREKWQISAPGRSGFGFMRRAAIGSRGAGALVVTLEEDVASRLITRRGPEDAPSEFPMNLSRYATEPAVAGGPQGYLVVWRAFEESDVLFATRVSPWGHVLHPSRIRISPSDESTIHNPRVIWDGLKYLVVWTEGPGICQITCPSYRGRTGVFAARVTADGTVLDPESIRVSSAETFADVAGTSFTSLVVMNDVGVRGRLIDEYGRVSDSILIAGSSEYLTNIPTVAWDGRAFVILHIRRSGPDRLEVIGSRVSIDGGALEQSSLFEIETVPPPFEFIVSPHPEMQVESMGNGKVVVLYARLAMEWPYHGVRRLFVRYLDTANRRRAIAVPER